MVATRRSASGNQSSTAASSKASSKEGGSQSQAAGSKRTKAESSKEENRSGSADRDEKATNQNTGKDAQEPESKKPKTESKKDDAVLQEQHKQLESHQDALSWLHSDAAWQMAHPDVPSGKGERDAADAGDTTARPAPAPYENKRPAAGAEGHLSYPNSDLSPFQTLMCAVLLSKPISHRLGLRTIETLLNKPYYFRTVQDLIDAGNEGRRAGLWEARTQHKEKTAEQLGNLAEGLIHLCGEKQADSLEPVLDKALEASSDKEDAFQVADQIKQILTKEINGLGPGGVDIFLRRIQAQWPSVFPFADERTLKNAVTFQLITQKDLDAGVEGATSKLAETVADHVGFPLEDGKKDTEEAECGRWWFVRTLDVLIGLDIEKKMDDAVREAGVAK